MNAGKLTYALVLGFIALMPMAWAIDPIDHQPIADLAAALKNAGQVRIAQGIADVISRDTETGKVFDAKTPLMLTTESKTGAWTISVLHDKVVGSTLLIGSNLQQLQSQDAASLPTFDRSKAQQALAGLTGYDPAYYPDEVKRLVTSFGFRRIFTGQITLTTEPHFKAAMTPVFADILVIPATEEFIVLVTDQYGACGEIAFGNTFSKNP
jgi:hypothetical protein